MMSINSTLGGGLVTGFVGSVTLLITRRYGGLKNEIRPEFHHIPSGSFQLLLQAIVGSLALGKEK